jgi:hypothetical protein
MSEQSASGRAQSNRRRKWTIGGALGGAASLVTIITFLTANNGTSSSQSNNTNTVSNGGAAASTAISAFPASIQTDFLNECELNSPQQVCQCDLTWYEQHISLARLQQDATEESEGITVPDAVAASDACG